MEGISETEALGVKDGYSDGRSTASFRLSRLNAASVRPSETRCAGCCFPRSRVRPSRPSESRACLHEFSSIPGVVEDATDIILNLKQIPLKMNVEGPKTLYLRVDQPGEVTSRMIQEDPDVEILDKDVYIATVSEGGSLRIEMRVKIGRGYVSAEKNFDEDLPIGYIPVDSVHSPIRKVNYTVEAARLGQMTDYDKLTLDVWTNGAVSPQDAVGLAAKLLKDHMKIFINFEEEPEAEEITQEPVVRNDELDRSVEELELSVRSYNCLKNANITTIRELVRRPSRKC